MDRKSAVIDIKYLYYRKYIRLVEEKGWLKAFTHMNMTELDLVAEYIEENKLKPLMLQR